MTFTTITPANGALCQKRYKNNVDVSNFGISQWNLRKAVADASLTLHVIKKELQELNNGLHSIVRGELNDGVEQPFIRNDEVFSDTLTRLCIADVDCCVVSCRREFGLQQRIEILLNELPFLRGVGMVAQLSASAGLGKIKKGKTIEDKSTRLSVRLYILADEALYLSEWSDLMEPLSRIPETSDFTDNKGEYFDMSILSNPAKIVWTAPPIDINQEREQLNHSEVLLIEGKPLCIEEMRQLSKEKGHTRKQNTNKATGGTRKLNDKLRKFVWSLQYPRMLEECNELELDGKSLRNELLMLIYERVGLHSVADFDDFDNQILEKYTNLWRASWNNDRKKAKRDLASLRKWSQRKASARLLGVSRKIRTNLGYKVQKTEGKQITREEVQSTFDDEIALWGTDCGTGKTTVIEEEKKRAKNRKETLILIAPYRVAVGNSVDKDLISYNHYRLGARGKERVATEAKNSAWCHRSLDNIPFHLRNKDVVVIDECVDVFLDFARVDGLNENHDCFKTLLANAKRIVFLDKDINDTYGLNVIETYLEGRANRKVLWESKISYANDMTYHLMQDNYQAIWLGIEALRAGERVSFSFDLANYSNKTGEYTGNLQALHSLIKANVPKDVVGLSFDATSAPTELIEDFGNYIEELVDEGLNYLILSPLAPKAASYLPGDESKDFDLDVSIFTQPFTNGQKAYQTTRRMRRTIEHVVSLPYSKDFDADIEFWTFCENKGLVNKALTQQEKLKALYDEEEARRAANPRDAFFYIVDDAGAEICLANLLAKDTAKTKTKNDFSQNYEEDFAYLKKQHSQIKKQIKDGIEPEEINAMRALSQWRVIRDGKYDYLFQTKEDLQAFDYKTLKSLLKRTEKLTDDKVQSCLECLLQSEEERKIWTIHNVRMSKENRNIYGSVFDGIVSSIDNNSSIGVSFFKWYSSPTNEPIQMNLDEIDTDTLMKLIKANWRVLRQSPVKPHAKAKINAAYAFKWLCQILDLECSIRPEEEVVLKKMAVIKEKRKEKAGRYPKGLTTTIAELRVLEDIANKQFKGEALTKAESDYYATRQGVITIRKKKYIYSKLIDLLGRYEEEREQLENHRKLVSKIFDSNSDVSKDFGYVLGTSQ
jgi:hypothetical protein